MGQTGIFYRRAGERGGKTLIFLHGWLLTSDIFVDIFPLFGPRYTLYALDFRGHGRAAGVDPFPTVAKLADDLALLIERERLSDVCLVGHSMGAFAALEYLQKYGEKRVSGLAIVDMTLKIPCDESWECGLYGRWESRDIDPFVARIKENFVEGMVYYASHGLSGERDPQKLYGLYQSFFPALIREGHLNPEAAIFLYEDLLTKDYRDFYSSLCLPILLLYGGKSQVYPRKLGERLREMNSRARLKEFKEGTHLLFLEEPEVFVKYLQEMEA